MRLALLMIMAIYNMREASPWELRSIKERLLAKEKNTREGRMNLIDKAKRKFNRLKSAVKDDAAAVQQLYHDTVGSLLHHLYDESL